MRNISYKYNIGDVVALKPDHYFEADVMGQKVLITAAEILERKDYNGPCYALGGSSCFWKEACFAGIANELKNRLYSYEGAEVYTDLPVESSCDIESSSEPVDGNNYRELYLKALKKTYGKVPLETDTVEVGSLLEFTKAILEAIKEV